MTYRTSQAEFERQKVVDSETSGLSGLPATLETTEKDLQTSAATRSPAGRFSRAIYVRDLLWVLVARDMKLRYKRSILGFAWSLLNPLAQAVVFSFVFVLVLPLDIPNYPLFLLAGLLAWNWFNSSLLLGTGAIVDNRDLIKRPGFPAVILPAVRVTSDLIHFLLALVVLTIFLVGGGVPLTSRILLLPLVVVPQFALTLGLSYFVATFHVRFRDTQYLLAVVLQLFFFLTPIFYRVDTISARFQSVYRFNPMAHIIDAYRALLIRGELPNLQALLLVAVLAAGLLALGSRFFMRASHRFVEEL